MSTNTTETTPGTQTTTETPAASPAHLDDATAMISELQAMGQRVPAFSFPADGNSNRKLTATATVPQAAILKMTALVQTRPLLTGSDIGPAELREMVSIAQAYAPVPDEAEAFAGALRHTINSIMAKAGSTVLSAYETAKRQSKRPEGADLRPHVADMKRLLSTRFGKKSKHQAAQQPTQQPTPQAPTPSSPSAPTSSQPNVSHAASAAGATDVVVTSPATKPQ